MVLVASGPEKLFEIEKEVHKINPDIKTLTVPTDIRDPASVKALFKKIEETFGHADILINNAGVLKGKPWIHENDVGEWWDNFVCGCSDPSFVSSKRPLISRYRKSTPKVHFS